MISSMLLWWTIDSVSLPLVISCKGNSAVEIPVQSYVSQTESTSEFNFQCNYFILVKQHFRLKND